MPSQTYKRHPDTDKRAAEIFRLYQSGLTDRQIAVETGFHHASIGNFRKRHNLKPNYLIRRPLDLVDDAHARCSRCGEVKSLEGWPKAQDATRKRYRLSYCTTCRSEQIIAALNRGPEVFVRDRWKRLKLRSKKLGVICSITFEELWAQFQSQKGLCFYTDVPIRLEAGAGRDPLSFSIDKVEPHLGYVTGNVVIAANRANTIKHDMTLDEMRNWTPDWFRRVQMWRANGVRTLHVAEGRY